MRSYFIQISLRFTYSNLMYFTYSSVLSKILHFIWLSCLLRVLKFSYCPVSLFNNLGSLGVVVTYSVECPSRFYWLFFVILLGRKTTEQKCHYIKGRIICWCFIVNVNLKLLLHSKVICSPIMSYYIPFGESHSAHI